MAKFYGSLGFIEEQVETSPGIYEDVVVEKQYRGDVLRSIRTLQDGNSQVNENVSISNYFSVVADAYVYDHIFALRYINWMGKNWEVSNVEVQRPRILLRIGGLYNGQTPSTTSTS